MDAHALVSALKDLAIEQGKTPRRADFIRQFAGAEYSLTKHFGTYTALVQAAGLETYDDRRSGGKRRIDNSVFARDLEAHLDEYEPRTSGEKPQYSRTLFIPDIHFPFHSNRVLDSVYAFAEKEKPETIVQVGDLYDQYSHGRFPRSHNQFTPRQEQELARKGAEKMWATLKNAAPDARCVQMVGNHDVRPLKKILDLYPEAEDWVARMLTEALSFPGVETIMDTRQELELPGDIRVVHGYRTKLGDHRDHMLYNAVVGHSHVGGVVFRHLRGRVLWELNCGLAGDPEAKGLTYTPQRITNWTPGFGWLDSYGPRFIPVV